MKPLRKARLKVSPNVAFMAGILGRLRQKPITPDYPTEKKRTDIERDIARLNELMNVECDPPQFRLYYDGNVPRPTYLLYYTEGYTWETFHTEGGNVTTAYPPEVGFLASYIERVRANGTATRMKPPKAEELPSSTEHFREEPPWVPVKGES